MTPQDFTTALTTLGLDTHQAAAWLGVSVRAVQRYRKVGAPKVVERALERGVAMKLVLDDMIKDQELIDVDDWIEQISLALDWRE